MSKEDKTKEYIRKIFNCKDCIFYKDCMYGIGNNNVEEYNCRAQEEAESFKAGWDEAFKSNWIKVEDELPERMEEVFVIYEYQGYIQIATSCYIGEIVWYFGNSKIIAWMSIPSFDKILEDNKDVL